MSLLVGEDTAGLLFKLIFAFLAVCCALTIYAIRISSQEKPVTYQIAEISETLRSDTACEKYETLDSPSLQVSLKYVLTLANALTYSLWEFFSDPFSC